MKITVDPLTRIEGHLKFTTEVKENIVVDAHCSGEMFRGIEKALIGHDARVAQQVTQRVCGVCPYGHAEAASYALEDAMGIQPNRNGILLKNLAVGAYHLQDYLLHFYTLCALDYIDITAILNYKGKVESLVALKSWVSSELKNNSVYPAAPFLPRYSGDYINDQDINIGAIAHYLESIEIMAKLHKMVAIFGAKAPHPVTIEAGGVTVTPSVQDIALFSSYLQSAESFIRNKFIPDVVAVASAYPSYFSEGVSQGNLLSYPYYKDPDTNKFAFAGGASINGQYQSLDTKKIQEHHKYSYYSNLPDSSHSPLDGPILTPLNEQEFETEKNKKDGKYSWTRAPRYSGLPMEVGPVARIVNGYAAGNNPQLNKRVDQYNKQLGITIDNYHSVMGRHLSRAINADLLLQLLNRDIARVEPNQLAFEEHAVPKNRRGIGLTEATRGALGHWIETDNKGYIKRYEMIVPTTWNISPRDRQGQLGPAEQMLVGTKIADPNNPLELARIIRSSDPCMACSVH